MTTLTILVGALLYMTTYETRDVGHQMQDEQILNLAEAGVQRALRAIRDDVTSTTQTGTADIRGNDTSGSSSVGNVDRILYEEDGNATINNNSDAALLRTFDSNYFHSRITSISLGVRASRASGGTGATIQVEYTTNGGFPQGGNTVLTQALTTSLTTYTQNITADRAWTWSTILNSNFILRATRTAGNRDINLDWVFLRVTTEIDTNTESWFTGSWSAFPINLGGGTIQSVSITDEQAKAHLNTASQTLLQDLMIERGIASSTATTLAANTVTYRTATKPFDSVEEWQQVSGVAAADYNLMKDYFTVYSAINTGALRPTGNRAPININTASREVLEAVFDSLALGATDAASLATDIINTRAATPFTCFYSNNSLVTTDFYDFVRSRAYLSATGDPDEQDRVLDNADASSIVPVQGSEDFNAVSTEFCYESSAFKVESLADIDGRRMRIKTVVGDDGSHAFTTFTGDASSVGTRKENFE